MKKIRVIVYRQGRNWISNIVGYLYELPYWVVTSSDVKRYFRSQSEQDNVLYIVDFA